MRMRQVLAMLGVLGAVTLPGPSRPAQAQPSVDQVLSDFGVSSDDKQRVMNGEFVTPDLSNVSDRDLAVAVIFLVKTTPDSLAKQIITGDLITLDPQVQTHGRFSTTGSLADLAGLKLGNDAAQTLAGAQAGESLNLGTSEIAAFNAVPGGAPPAIQGQLQKMLLMRYQAYRTSGLTGIVPYDRGSGRTLDVGGELRKASQAAKGLEKYMPGLHAVLLDYPKATVPGMQHDFRWVNYNIQGKPTYVLVHMLVAPDGAARAVVERQYYVSTGYNADQAVSGLLPVQEGTMVFYAGHAFTDQVAGFGGAMKRGIGRRMMAGKLKDLFEADRAKAGR
jgi:hypothetical protein